MNIKQTFEPTPYQEAIIWQVLMKLADNPNALKTKEEQTQWDAFQAYLLPSIKRKIQLFLNRVFDGKRRFKQQDIDTWAQQGLAEVFLLVMRKIRSKELVQTDEPIAKTFRKFVKYMIMYILQKEQVIKKIDNKNALTPNELKIWYNLRKGNNADDLLNDDLLNKNAYKDDDDDIIDEIDLKNNNLLNDILSSTSITATNRNHLMQQKWFQDQCKQDPIFKASYKDYKDYLVQTTGKGDQAARTHISRNRNLLVSAIEVYTKAEKSLTYKTALKLVRRFFPILLFLNILTLKTALHSL